MSEHPPPKPEHIVHPSDVAGDLSRGSGVTRRTFIQTLGVGAAATAVGTDDPAEARTPMSRAQDPEVLGPDPFNVTLRVNGSDLTTPIDPATTLMETLRWHLNLTGTKEVCDRGSCGACSVLLDGQVVMSCMMLAVDAVDREIATVEGLAPDADAGDLDPLQEAFIRHDALQCGYCTPGLLIACRALLNETPQPTLDEIRKGISGNICRCGTYTNIFNAVLEASGQQPIADTVGKGVA